MNSASTQIAVAPTTQTTSPALPSPSPGPISHKDFHEEPLPRQNSLGASGNRHRGGGAKGKHLTRSHAMRESTSPPRTPTPRSDLLTSTASSPMTSCGVPVNTVSVSQAYADTTPATSSDSRLQVQSSATSTSPTSGSPSSPNVLDTPSVIVTQQSQQQQQQQSQTSPPIIFSTDDGGRSQLDVDFPKLTPPKSKSPRNTGGGGDKSNVGQQTSPKVPQSNHATSNSGTNTETIAIPNHHHHHHRHQHQNTSPGNVSPCSQHSSNGGTVINVVDTSPIPSPQGGQHGYEKEGRMREGHCNYDGESGESPSDGPTSGRGMSDRGGKKHRNGPGAKGTKPRLKAMGSSSSAEGSGASGNGGCAGGDNLAEQYTDQSGVDLIQFFKETLNKNIKDRTMLLRIEKELLALVYDRTRSQTKFPPTSSYNRMLIHRTAAYFGMDHNVDATQTCVIAEVSKNTRVPEIRFETLIREMDEPRKSILKRDSHSFDEYRQGLLPCPDRGMLDRKSKSFEEREEEYERARRRIFKDRDCGGADCSVEEQHWPWSSSESSENSGRHKMAQNNRLLKVQSLSVDTRGDGRPCVSKSHSFGGYGGPMQSSGPPGHQLSRGDSVTSTKSAGPRLFPKQDSVGSTNTPWRCSPSSSGYKTQTQSLRSDSITPSPTGYGSGDHTPEPQSVLPSPAARGVVWAVTDMASVPRGSVLIDPQTLQPIVNQDGSLYLFDPSNLPPGNLHNNNNNNIMIKPPTHVPRNKKYDKTKSSMRNNDICDGNENNNSLTHSVIMENQTASSSTEDLTSPQIDEEEAHGRQSESPMQLHHQAGENTKISPQKMQKSQATSPNIPTQEIILQSGGLNEIPSIATNQSTSATPASTAVAVNCEGAYLTTNASSATTNAVTTSPAAESAVIPSTTVTNAIITTTFTTTSGTQSATNHPHQPSSTSQTNATHSSNNVQDTTAKVHHQHPRQEDGAQLAKSSVMPSVIPVMGYTTTTGYPAMENGAIFPAPNAPYPTYQQGPDGSVYAVPPMVYAYPPPMESEMSGYFLPMYDQAGTPRDSGLMPAPTPTAALYQPAAAAAAATVVPMTPYAPTAYSSGPLYTQGQVVYTAATDQFGSPAAAAAATPQYPIPAYPTMTYPYPTYNGTTTYQGYWGQPMATTYYVPQPQLLPHPASTANGTAGGGSKRGSPPQNVQQQQTHGSNPSTPQTTTFNNPFGSTGVPIAAAAGDPGTMYALPQPVYPNMLPYASPATVPVSATAAVSHLPHHPHSHHAATDGVKIRYGVMSTTQQQQPTQQTHSNQMHNNTTDPAQSSYNAQTSGTPQSTPSTPLSLPLPLPTGHMAAKGGPPIFPTPPIMTNGFGPQFPGGGGAPTTAGENGYGGAGGQYERKNHTNGSGGPQQQQQHSSQPNRNRNGALGPRQQQTSYSGGVVGMTQSAGGASGHPVKKNLSHDNTPNNNVGRPTNPGGAFQKGRSDGASVGGKPMGGGGHMGPPGGNVVAQPGDKGPAARGPRPKPANLDLRRSNSQRNTPSTNSTESNNSPNSIASSEQQPVYMARGTHNPPLAHHHPATAMGIDPAACHQPLIGAAYNPAAGMYVKFGQTYFTHPTMGLASSRRSPPSDVRPPPLTPIAPGMYPMNMMLPAPRHLGPRPAHSGGYKGNKGGHPPSGVAASGGPR